MKKNVFNKKELLLYDINLDELERKKELENLDSTYRLPSMEVDITTLPIISEPNLNDSTISASDLLDIEEKSGLIDIPLSNNLPLDNFNHEEDMSNSNNLIHPANSSEEVRKIEEEAGLIDTPSY